MCTFRVFFLDVNIQNISLIILFLQYYIVTDREALFITFHLFLTTSRYLLYNFLIIHKKLNSVVMSHLQTSNFVTIFIFGSETQYQHFYSKYLKMFLHLESQQYYSSSGSTKLKISKIFLSNQKNLIHDLIPNSSVSQAINNCNKNNNLIFTKNRFKWIRSIYL